MTADKGVIDSPLEHKGDSKSDCEDNNFEEKGSDERCVLTADIPDSSLTKPKEIVEMIVDEDNSLKEETLNERMKSETVFEDEAKSTLALDEFQEEKDEELDFETPKDDSKAKGCSGYDCLEDKSLEDKESDEIRSLVEVTPISENRNPGRRRDGHRESLMDSGMAYYGFQQHVEEDAMSDELGPNKEDFRTSNMPFDTYTFLFVADLFSFPFWYAIMIFLTQMVIHFLIIINLIDFGDANNPLMIPSGVAWEVSVSQFFALFLTTSSLMPEILPVVILSKFARSKLDLPEQKITVNKKIYNLHNAMFCISNSLRLIESVVSATSSLLLIIQSTEVIELFFNFAALQFVSFVDNLAFLVARDWLFGFSTLLERTVEIVSNTKISTPLPEMKKALRNATAMLCVAQLILFITWAYVIVLQTTGYYYCSSISVQLADDFEFSCGQLSGIYIFSKGSYNDGRPVYEKRDVGATLKYEMETETWRFEGLDCTVYSIQTKAYDMVELSEMSTWHVYNTRDKEDGIDIVGVLSQFSLTCIDCRFEECSGGGRCVNNRCICEPLYDGPMCEMWNPAIYCEFFVEGTVFEGTVTNDAWAIIRTPGQTEEEYLKLYQRPVYFGYDKSTMEPLNVFAAFTGRRWILAGVKQFFGVEAYQDVVEVLSNWNDGNIARALAANVGQVYRVSEPSIYGTMSQLEVVNSKKWSYPEWERGGANFYQPDVHQSFLSLEFVCVPQCDSSRFKHLPIGSLHEHWPNCGRIDKDFKTTVESLNRTGVSTCAVDIKWLPWFAEPSNCRMTGVEVCEGHGWNEKRCEAWGCCRFEEGECYSDIESNVCLPETKNIMETCEGKTEEDCLTHGCCEFGWDRCKPKFNPDPLFNYLPCVELPPLNGKEVCESFWSSGGYCEEQGCCTYNFTTGKCLSAVGENDCVGVETLDDYYGYAWK